MTAPTRNRRWIWVFGFLVVLSVAFAAGKIWFNLRQQLTAEQLEQARAKWQANRPRDYDLRYVKKMQGTEMLEVRVRDGRVVWTKLDGQPLEARLNNYHDMDNLFDYIETFWQKDHEPGRPRTFATAQFDPHDGHLIHYVRSVSATRERVEINVKLTRVAEERSGS